MNISNEDENKDLIEMPHQNGFHASESVSICVSIEPNHESEIYELKYDGQEIYKE